MGRTIFLCNIPESKICLATGNCLKEPQSRELCEKRTVKLSKSMIAPQTGEEESNDGRDNEVLKWCCQGPVPNWDGLKHHNSNRQMQMRDTAEELSFFIPTRVGSTFWLPSPGRLSTPGTIPSGRLWPKREGDGWTDAFLSTLTGNKARQNNNPCQQGERGYGDNDKE